MKQELILCKCGCGQSRLKYDNEGKERKYIHHHHFKSEESIRKRTETRKRLFKEGKLIPPMLGKKLSEETKRKISLAGKGRKHTEETKQKMSLTSKGIKHSKESKLKISLARKGRKLSEEHKRKFCYANLGKKLSEEVKQKMRKPKPKGFNLTRLGIKNPNWRGGKSFEPYDYNFNSQFKEMIRERDNHTCQLCKKQKPEIKQLQVHHIDYNKTNSTTFNCITLCEKCHSLTNFDRDKWEVFFQSYLRDKYNYNIFIKQKIIKEDE